MINEDLVWYKSCDYLPECDVEVYVSNDPTKLNNMDFGVLYYDGWGFKCYSGPYKNPTYWAHVPPRIKRYGKVR